MDSRNFLAFSLCLILIFVIKHKTCASSFGFDPSRVTQLSWTPRAFLYKGFLSNEECDHLINLAKGKLEKSMVSVDDSNENVESEDRTSSGMFLDKRQDYVSAIGQSISLNANLDIPKDDIVANVEAKLAAWTFLPEENGESLQILHYENGQKYEPHYDTSLEETILEHGGHRIITVLMYLSNVKKGGETVFPKWKGKKTQLKDDTWSECAKQGYAVKPRKGDAVLFFSLHPNVTIDQTSLHGSCPVIDGEKWSATRWIHVRSFDKEFKNQSGCVDENESCEKWARVGECEKNPTYMVGSETDYGYCRKSCKACSSQEQHEQENQTLIKE